MANLRVDPRHGIHDPTAGTPPRAPGSVRRTSTLDSHRPRGVSGPLRIVGRARDVVTSATGDVDVSEEVGLSVWIDYVGGYLIESLESDPPEPRLSTLVVAARLVRLSGRHAGSAA